MSLSTEAGMQFLRCNHLVDVGLDVDYTPVVDAWNAVVSEKNRIKSIANLRIKSTLSRPQLRVLASAVPTEDDRPASRYAISYSH